MLNDEYWLYRFRDNGLQILIATVDGT
jgi:hypothetical protein